MSSPALSMERPARQRKASDDQKPPLQPARAFRLRGVKAVHHMRYMRLAQHPRKPAGAAAIGMRRLVWQTGTPPAAARDSAGSCSCQTQRQELRR